MLDLVAKALLAYLIGSVMGGQIVGALRGGVDLRRLGSGNVGATNALRTQGAPFALAVLAIDVAKGVLACLAVPALDPLGTRLLAPRELAYVCGVAVALGHCYPLLSGFRGGKGVATLAGVFGALLPASLPWLLGGFLLVVLLTGYVSLATVFATLVAVFYTACIGVQGLWSAAGAFTLAMALLILWKHRDNLRRLAAGSEHRFERARILGRALDRMAGRWRSR